MKIAKEKDDSILTIALEGRLDTNTSPELTRVLEDNLTGVAVLVMDMGQLDYISSAGLRVLLAAQKEMAKQGKMVLKNVSPNVLEVLEITGFSGILTLE